MDGKIIDIKAKGATVSLQGPVPVTEDSYPFSAANRQYVPLDLASYGYVEEEFIISGLANVYEWYNIKNGPARVRTPDAPYTTRILVRRPVDKKRFSGDVVVEPFNWARGYDNPWGAWAEAYEYFLAHGDAWVGVTIRPSSVPGLQKFNPARYAALSFKNPLPPEETCQNPGCYPTPSSPLTEDGLNWDIISHVGALMKSADPSSPLAGYNVEYVFAAGATGGDLSAYVSAIHPLARLTSGKPIYDGYVIKCTGSPGCINQCEPKITPDDPRCKLYADVPVIRINTQSDILGVGFHPDWSFLQRRPDGDGPGEQFRLYEVAGAVIQSTYANWSSSCKEDALTTGTEWLERFDIPLEASDFEFPLRYIINGAFANLDLWVRKGIAPPRADRLATVGEYPEVSFDFDEFGNVKGGVRTPYVDVPVVKYDSVGKVIPFEKELLKKLYPTHEQYVNEVVKQTDALLQERWITEADARAIKEAAARSEIP